MLIISIKGVKDKIYTPLGNLLGILLLGGFALSIIYIFAEEYIGNKIFPFLLVSLGIYAFASLVTYKVESRLKDRLNEIEDKLGIN